jgi:Dyp-type peroxidase family
MTAKKGEASSGPGAQEPANDDVLDLTAAADKADEARLVEAFEELGRLEVKLPKGVGLSALGAAVEAEVPGLEPEPVYGPKQRGNIQGNIIPGFNKDHQHYLFFRLGKTERAKQWLRWIAPLISSMDDVLAFVRAHRAMRLRLGVIEPPMCATWVNVAFSHGAIGRLVSAADAKAFGDQSFRQGLAARSTFLGDPSDAAHPGHRDRWLVGGPKNEADVLVIVAADDPHHLQTMVDVITREATGRDLQLLFEQRGDTLPEPLRGHEHFGFKDGVSQPGIRGKVSSAPGDYITPRYIDPADPRARYFARPGQILVWPGEFLLGELRQSTEDLVTSAPPASNFPRWAALGSYLVCRRLLQDVPAFWAAAVAASSALGIPSLQFASMLVGRWPSGAPLMRAPTADDPALARDPWANNHFIFDDDTRPIPLRPIPGYPGDLYPQARADLLGDVCPHFAHIRKTNPRDSATDLGKPQDTLLRLLLRRGIPFGPPVVGVNLPYSEVVSAERGLMFVSYASTIESQFEFITRRWANSAIQPNLGGHDPIIGQRDERGSRTRIIDVPLPGGGRKRVKLAREWITPTGGGYFFAPPIEAISGVLGA